MSNADFGWHLPADDVHFREYFEVAPEVDGRRMYQPAQIEAAMAFANWRRSAIDVGAHVGCWSFYLAESFARVHAFEPVEAFRRCFEANVPQDNVTLHACALGSMPGRCELIVDPRNTGETHISSVGSGGVEVMRLDDFGFDDVGFIKIDVEGFERYVLEGARETLLRCKPAVLVEQKDFGTRYGLAANAPEQFLVSLGFKPIQRIVKDTMFVWPEAR